MEQLSNFDELCLATESLTANSNISSLSIYDQSQLKKGPVKFRQILEATNKAVHEVPRLRQKLQKVPFGLDNSYWVDDENFDLEYHVRHIALPQPGDWRQLCIQFSRLHSRPLDLNRPLWEIYVIEGLNSVANAPAQSFAVMLKLHHAMVDGASTVKMIELMHDNVSAHDANAKKEVSFHRSYQPYEPLPGVSQIQLLSRAAKSNIAIPLKVAKLAGKLLSTPSSRGGAEDPAVTAPQDESHSAPVTRFNVKISPHRVFDAMVVEFDAIRTIKSAVNGATVNDAATSIIGGGLRKYLQAKHDLPNESLTTVTPVSLRKAGDNDLGNKVSFINHTVGSDIADPIERLAGINRATKAAKSSLANKPVDIMREVLDIAPAHLLAGARTATNYLSFATGTASAQNTVISNVLGPQQTLYMGGARLLATYGASIAADNQALSHALGSYDGKFIFNFTACRQTMPDPEFYRQCLQDSFNETLAAAQKVLKKPRRKTTGNKKRAPARTKRRAS